MGGDAVAAGESNHILKMEEWPLAWFDDDPWISLFSNEDSSSSTTTTSTSNSSSLLSSRSQTTNTVSQGFKRARTVVESETSSTFDVVDFVMDLTKEITTKNRPSLLDSYSNDRLGGGGALSNLHRDPWAWSCKPHPTRKGQFSLNLLIFEHKKSKPIRMSLILLAPPTRFGQSVSLMLNKEKNSNLHLFISDASGTSYCVDLSRGKILSSLRIGSATTKASTSWWTHDEEETTSNSWYGFEDGSVSLLSMNTQNLKSKIVFTVTHPEDEPDGLASRIWRALPGTTSSTGDALQREEFSQRAVAGLFPLSSLAVFCVYADGRCVVVDATTPNWTTSMTSSPAVQPGSSMRVKICSLPTSTGTVFQLKVLSFTTSRILSVSKSSTGVGYEIHFSTPHFDEIDEQVNGYLPKGLISIKASETLISCWYDPSTKKNVFHSSSRGHHHSKKIRTFSSYLLQREFDVEQDDDLLFHENNDANDEDYARTAQSRLSLPHRYQSRHVRRGVSKVLHLNETSLSTSNELLNRFIKDQTHGQRRLWRELCQEIEQDWRSDFDEILDVVSWTYEASIVVRPIGLFVLFHSDLNNTSSFSMEGEAYSLTDLMESLSSIGNFAYARSSMSARTMRQIVLPITTLHPGMSRKDFSLWPSERYGVLQILENLVDSSSQDNESEDVVLKDLKGLSVLKSVSLDSLGKQVKAFLSNSIKDNTDSMTGNSSSTPLYVTECLTNALRCKADYVRRKAWNTCLGALRCSPPRRDSLRSSELNEFAQLSLKHHQTVKNLQNISKVCLEIFLLASKISMLCSSPVQKKSLSTQIQQVFLLDQQQQEEDQDENEINETLKMSSTVGELCVRFSLKSYKGNDGLNILVHRLFDDLMKTSSFSSSSWLMNFLMIRHQYPILIALTTRFPLLDFNTSDDVDESSLETKRRLALMGAKALLGSVSIASSCSPTLNKDTQIQQGWIMARNQWMQCSPSSSNTGNTMNPKYDHFMNGAKSFMSLSDYASGLVLSLQGFDFSKTEEEKTKSIDLSVTCAMKSEDYVKAIELISEFSSMKTRQERFQQVVERLCVIDFTKQSSKNTQQQQLMSLTFLSPQQIEITRNVLLSKIKEEAEVNELFYWTAYTFFLRHGLYTTACYVLWCLSEVLLFSKKKQQNFDAKTCENVCACCLSALKLSKEQSFLVDHGKVVTLIDVEKRLIVLRAMRETNYYATKFLNMGTRDIVDLMNLDVLDLQKVLLEKEKYETLFLFNKLFQLNSNDCVATLMLKSKNLNSMRIKKLLKDNEKHANTFDLHLHAADVLLSSTTAAGEEEIITNVFSWLERVLIFGHEDENCIGYGFTGNGRGDPIGYLNLLLRHGRVLRATRLVCDLIPSGTVLMETKYLRDSPWLPMNLLDEIFRAAQSTKDFVDVKDKDDREALNRAVQLIERRLTNFFDAAVSIELVGKNALLNSL